MLGIKNAAINKDVNNLEYLFLTVMQPSCNYSRLC